MPPTCLESPSHPVKLPWKWIVLLCENVLSFSSMKIRTGNEFSLDVRINLDKIVKTLIPTAEAQRHREKNQ